MTTERICLHFKKSTRCQLWALNLPDLLVKASTGEAPPKYANLENYIYSKIHKTPSCIYVCSLFPRFCERIMQHHIMLHLNTKAVFTREHRRTAGSDVVGCYLFTCPLESKRFVIRFAFTAGITCRVAPAVQTST